MSDRAEHYMLPIRPKPMGESPSGYQAACGCGWEGREWGFPQLCRDEYQEHVAGTESSPDRAERRWRILVCEVCGERSYGRLHDHQPLDPAVGSKFAAVVPIEVAPVAELDALREERDEVRKQMRRASERLDGIVTEQINAPLSLAEKHRAMFDETGEISAQLREGQVHYDDEWDQLEARAEAAEQKLTDLVERAVEELERRRENARFQAGASQERGATGDVAFHRGQMVANANAADLLRSLQSPLTVTSSDPLIGQKVEVEFAALAQILVALELAVRSLPEQGAYVRSGMEELLAGPLLARVRSLQSGEES